VECLDVKVVENQVVAYAASIFDLSTVDITNRSSPIPTVEPKMRFPISGYRCRFGHHTARQQTYRETSQISTCQNKSQNLTLNVFGSGK
jgi:hypothetical protein